MFYMVLGDLLIPDKVTLPFDRLERLYCPRLVGIGLLPTFAEALSRAS